MKTINQLFIFGLILVPNILSAQMSANRIINDQDHMASLSGDKSHGHQPEFIHYYGQMSKNVTPHDTVQYKLVVDATAHLNMASNEEPAIADTMDHKKQRKIDIATSLHAALLNHDILFDYNDYSLTEVSKLLLDNISIVMLQNPDAVFEIGGHADARGVYSDNLILTERRVESAIAYLVSKGVKRGQLVAMAYGESVLKNVCDSDSHCSEEVHASNRRIEIKVISVGN